MGVGKQEQTYGHSSFSPKLSSFMAVCQALGLKQTISFLYKVLNFRAIEMI